MRVSSTQFTKAVCRPKLPIRKHQPYSPRCESNTTASEDNNASSTTSRDEDQDGGAMSRRLSEMSEDALADGGRSARKAVEEAGFSEELRARLQDKIAGATFKSENAAAFATANLPASAGKGTADIAGAKAWTGIESLEDGALRMLNDAHKPLRTKRAPPLPSIRGPPKSIDTGRPTNKATGTRLANARDKSSIYSYLRDDNLTEEEKEKFRKELKERFSPGARSIPATIQGLQSLANERIEDAIARGQFKNIPRGKQIERDHNASNPFLDTTEYFMNKMIQKQEIVPPWIEKQQELNAAVARFRAQLRAGWRRHVSRTIASKGGSLQDQMRLAAAYALAEKNQTKDAAVLQALADTTKDPPTVETAAAELLQAKAESQEPAPEMQAEPLPQVSPFRDSQWEATELGYHTIAVKNLNDLTRSYNLMAPDLAKKPYYTLPRELKSCFSDVAPEVAEAIRERALAPKVKVGSGLGNQPSGILGALTTRNATKVYDDRRAPYGLKELWRDLFSKKD